MLDHKPTQSQPVVPMVYPPYGPDRPGPTGQTILATERTQSVQAPAFYHTPQPGMPRPPEFRRSRARKATLFALTCLLALVFGIGLFSGWQFARSAGSTSPLSATSALPANPGQGSPALSSLETVREAAIAQAKPAVVEIQGRVPQGIALGSGVIIDHQGNIVTNNHVVSGASSLTVTLNDGTQVPARLVGNAPTQDLAIIHIQPVAQMTVATPGDSAQLSVGQEVLAIGSPLGYDGTVTMGVVSALNRDVDETHGVRLSGLIQTSAAINPGNSGGALINLQGQIVGIPTLSALNNETNTPAEGIGFAIPSNTVLAVAARIMGN